jgi:hypothetical protein
MRLRPVFFRPVLGILFLLLLLLAGGGKGSEMAAGAPGAAAARRDTVGAHDWNAELRDALRSDDRARITAALRTMRVQGGLLSKYTRNAEAFISGEYGGILQFNPIWPKADERSPEGSRSASDSLGLERYCAAHYESLAAEIRRAPLEPAQREFLVVILTWILPPGPGGRDVRPIAQQYLEKYLYRAEDVEDILGVRHRVQDGALGVTITHVRTGWTGGLLLGGALRAFAGQLGARLKPSPGFCLGADLGYRGVIARIDGGWVNAKVTESFMYEGPWASGYTLDGSEGRYSIGYTVHDWPTGHVTPMFTYSELSFKMDDDTKKATGEDRSFRIRSLGVSVVTSFGIGHGDGTMITNQWIVGWSAPISGDGDDSFRGSEFFLGFTVGLGIY